MQLQNKEKTAYLGALALLFSYAELLLPRVVPFFRLGLGNIAILLALPMDFSSFFVLTIIKALASSITGGTLLSPFFLISLLQSVFSGLAMFGLYRIKKNWLSVFGISILGSCVSALVQIGLTAVYLGKHTFILLGPMLIFSIISGFITAFGSITLKIPEQAPAFKTHQESEHPKKQIILGLLILAGTTVCFIINNIYFLIGALILAFILQGASGRRIFILPHISIWIFIILISLFTPNGKVLLKVGPVSITQTALLLAITKALKLSIAVCLSQCVANLKPNQNSLLGLSLNYYKGLLNYFRNSNGKLINRLQQTLSATEL